MSGEAKCIAADLAGNPQYGDLLASMKAKLKAFQERTNDPWTLKWEHE